MRACARDEPWHCGAAATVRPATIGARTLPLNGPAVLDTGDAPLGGAGGTGIVLLNGRSHTVSALNPQADEFHLVNVLAPGIHVLYLGPINHHRSEQPK
jgi:hypothetical protein